MKGGKHTEQMQEVLLEARQAEEKQKAACGGGMRSSVKGTYLLGTVDFSRREAEVSVEEGTSDECVGLCGEGAHIWVLRREEFKGCDGIWWRGAPSKGC